MTRIIFFDVFGTLLDMSKVPKHELQAYGDHLREYQETGVYKELTLPALWRYLPVFPDVKPALQKLNHSFWLYTLSNGPVELTGAALKGQGLMVGLDLRTAKGFKPAKWVYPWACGVVGLAPSDCMMVTANKSFGDIEGAEECGMKTALIRHESGYKDLLDLAKELCP